MKTICAFLIFLVAPGLVSADSLPVITVQPQSLHTSGFFFVTASNATAYQWRYNGDDLVGQTNSTCWMSTTGYYAVVVKNATGWVPSKLAYGFITNFPYGVVPFDNSPYPAAQALGQYGLYPGGVVPITNGTAQVVAGPELDQMQPVGYRWQFYPEDEGYFYFGDQSVLTVRPGQTVYYRVDLTYPAGGGTHTQPSTTLKLVAGDPFGPIPTPSIENLWFPVDMEWPTVLVGWPVYGLDPVSPTNQVRIPGETVNLHVAYATYHVPTVQWRKDGRPIPGATNLVHRGETAFWSSVFTIASFQPSDVGVYDVAVAGDHAMICPSFYLSIQLTNGQARLVSPRIIDTNFVSDLQGVSGRSYEVLWSTNLTSWYVLQTLSNVVGTATFSNAPAGERAKYYRARLLPLN